MTKDELLVRFATEYYRIEIAFSETHNTEIYNIINQITGVKEFETSVFPNAVMMVEESSKAFAKMMAAAETNTPAIVVPVVPPQNH